MHAAIGEFSFPLEKSSRTILGRKGADLDLELAWDKRISRRHGAVWVEAGAVWYEDLGSRNGSWSGRDRLSGPQRIGPGESIVIGETALIVPTLEEMDGMLNPVEVTHDQDDIFQEATTALYRLSEADQQALPEPEEVVTTLPHRAQTDDLRAERAPPSASDRRARRILEERRVDLAFANRAELREVWLRDISKGGLYVEMNEAPPPGTRLIVHIDTPAGPLQLNAAVVHVVDASRAARFGMAPGAGLAFTDLDQETKDAIRDYVDGAADALEVPVRTIGDGPKDLEEVVEQVKRLLQHVENNAFYAALELVATASTEAIAERVTELTQRFDEAANALPPPQAARIRAAQNALLRLSRVLGFEQSRLEYDFMFGHVRAYERLSRAQDGSGPSLQVLRRTWRRIWPDRVDQAALYTRQAFSARQSGSLETAIKHGKHALELNPFFDEFRKTVECWEQTLRKQKAEENDPLGGIGSRFYGRGGKSGGRPRSNA